MRKKIKFLKVKNSTKLKLPIDLWQEILHPYVEKTINILIYPISVIFRAASKNNAWYTAKPEIIIEITPSMTLEELNWTFMHEFRHHMQEDPLLNAQLMNSDREQLIRILQSYGKLTRKEVLEKFHDLMPEEIDANIFATEIMGYVFKHRRFLGYRGKTQYIDKIYKRKDLLDFPEK